MEKQALRNALAAIEDDARAARNAAGGVNGAAYPFALIVQLAQLIREEVVK